MHYFITEIIIRGTNIADLWDTVDSNRVDNNFPIIRFPITDKQ